MRHILEGDWKKVRAMKDELLGVCCDRILNKAGAIIADRSNGSHAAYIALWRLIEKEDDTVVRMFDDLKRSTAIFKLVAWKRHGLISDAELEKFSPETQESVRAMA
jgi:hypothetical protein